MNRPLPNQINFNSKESRFENKVIFLILFALVLYFIAAYLSLGNHPFYTRGEAREALVVADMFEQNNFILPLRNGEVVPSKPPMFHWFAVLASKTLGEISEVSIRLPSLVCAFLTIAVFIWGMGKHCGLFPAVFASAIMATSFEWIRGASHARVDMCFTFFLTAALLCLYCLCARFRKGQRINLFYVIVTGFMIAGAVLAKGPAGIILPLAVTVVFLALSSEGRISSFTKLTPFFAIISAVIIAILVSGIWYYLAYLLHGAYFIEVQFLKENISRVVDLEGLETGHHKPFYFSVVYFILGFLPWSIFFFISYPTLKSTIQNQREDIRQFLKFCLSWVLVFLVVITISSSKRTVYFLPAFPGASALIATVLLTISGKINAPQYARNIFTAFFILLTLFIAVVSIATLPPVLPLSLPLLSGLESHSFSPSMLSNLPLLPLLTLTCTGLLIGITFFWHKQIAPLASTFIVILMLFTSAYTETYISPAIASRQSPKEFMAEVLIALPDKSKLYQFEHDFYPAVFYAKSDVHPIESLSHLAEHLPAYILVRTKDVDKLSKSTGDFKIILTSDTYAANGEDTLSLVYYSAQKAVN